MKAAQSLIERLRERQGNRNQTTFAEFLGISLPTLSRLYSGEREVGMDTLMQIGKVYPDLAFLFLSESVVEGRDDGKAKGT